MIEDDPATVYAIELDRVREVRDPYEDHVWGPWVISIDEVARAVVEGRIAPIPEWAADFPRGPPAADDRAYHIERIAYLVLYPSDDPISIEVVDTCGSTIINDGHHRIAAGIFRADQKILVDYGGYVDAFRQRFLAPRIPE